MTHNIHNGVKKVLDADRRLRLDLANPPLSLAEAFEPGAFLASQLRLDVGQVVRVTATDGRCWAEVVEVDANGRLTLAPDTVFAADDGHDAAPASTDRMAKAREALAAKRASAYAA